MLWRNITIFFLIIILGGSGYLVFQKDESCDEPLAYTLGFVDQRHGLTEIEFLNLIKEAEDVWESALQKNLFEFNEDASLKINLIFDDRQKELLDLKKGGDTLDNDLNQLKNEKLLLEKLQNDYEKKSSDYNNQVAFWNAGPRTDSDEFDKLKKAEQELGILGKELDTHINNYNVLVQNHNKSVSEFNTTAVFEEKGGVTLGNKEINIFILNGDKSDVFLIAHELGHAVGIDGHIDDQNSLMYYKLSEELTEVSEKDIELISRVCAIE